MNIVDTIFINQLVESMELAVGKLDEALLTKDFEKVKKLKVFVFDLQSKLNSYLEKND